MDIPELINDSAFNFEIFLLDNKAELVNRAAEDGAVYSFYRVLVYKNYYYFNLIGEVVQYGEDESEDEFSELEIYADKERNLLTYSGIVPINEQFAKQLIAHIVAP